MRNPKNHTSPSDNATNVAVDTPIIAIFDESKDASTLTTATFTLVINGGFPIAGTVSYLGTIATFTLSFNLTFKTSYTATIKTGANYLEGNALSTNYTWTFTTETGRGHMN